jgi:hypothetical protein
MSGRESPRDTSKDENDVNASGSNDQIGKDKSRKKDKRDKKDRDKESKEKEKEQKEEGGADAAPPSGKATPQLHDMEDADQLKSPTESVSTGVRTPTTRRPNRNPWTIFMRMSVPANEAEVREFFAEAKEGVSTASILTLLKTLIVFAQITRIKYPGTAPGRAQKIVYIEFGDEKAMRDGLEKHAEVGYTRL